ncbi:Pseudomurein-binding repeat-containing protein [Methanobacterium lacus]|uniref:Pseudomurein-binding repeat-containing protein n=1 Tax=Methanobacterium lacus (strain AL-21) TaxID=877455 RepID=F0T7M7_METLA|nr:pseudomurein-binding repeat-containing protein [Methanobacterium lacus]ADZ09595.1 Pseudomurein-binding repeat-containing protein [Methanobacterium lacus]
MGNGGIAIRKKLLYSITALLFLVLILNIGAGAAASTAQASGSTTGTIKTTTTSNTTLVSGLTSAQIKDGYTRAQNFYNTNHRLPNYVSYGTKKVMISDFQTILATQGLKINMYYSRPVYITSDNINNKTADNTRINNIVTGLKALGIKAYNMGIGPNTHVKVLQNTNVPQNALIVDIYGGADAGTLLEMGQSWYKKIKGARSVYSIFWPPSKVITGLAFLERAHDDNYSPASFTGLANPDQYLINNGYNYIYSKDIKTIVNSIFKQVSTN